MEVTMMLVLWVFLVLMLLKLGTLEDKIGFLSRRVDHLAFVSRLSGPSIPDDWDDDDDDFDGVQVEQAREGDV